MQNKMSFLRILRLQQGLSLFAVGAKCGVKESRLSECVLGRMAVYPKYRRALSVFFKVSESELFDENGFAK